MRSRQMYTRSDMILLGLGAVCIAVVAVSSNMTVDVITGLPLTVYLPGAAMVSTLGPQRHRANWVERQMWIVGASFGLTVIGGLVLNLASGLTRSSWLIWIAIIVVFCNALKLMLPLGPSRDGAPSAAAPDAGDRNASNPDEEAIGGPAGPRDGRGPITASVRRAVLLLGAGAICAAALILSIHTDASTTRESFVQAWVLPRPSEDVTSTSVQLGLRNHLGYRRTFLVDVTVGKGVSDIFSVPLANGESWTHVISRRPGERVESTVSTSSQPSVVFTRVYLATPVT